RYSCSSNRPRMAVSSTKTDELARISSRIWETTAAMGRRSPAYPLRRRCTYRFKARMEACRVSSVSNSPVEPAGISPGSQIQTASKPSWAKRRSVWGLSRTPARKRVRSSNMRSRPSMVPGDTACSGTKRTKSPSLRPHPFVSEAGPKPLREGLLSLSSASSAFSPSGFLHHPTADGLVQLHHHPRRDRGHQEELQVQDGQRHHIEEGRQEGNGQHRNLEQGRGGHRQEERPVGEPADLEEAGVGGAHIEAVGQLGKSQGGEGEG